MSVETLIKNSCETNGEGPHWDESTGTLLYVSINDGTVHRWDSKTRINESYKFDTSVSFIIPRKQGGYVIGLGQTIARFDWDTKAVTVLHTVDKGKETKLNDGKCDAVGRLWCGTMGFEKSRAEVDPGLGSLYCVDLDGSVSKQKEGVTISNGLAWTSDSRTMFYIDSTARQVYGYDYDLAAGAISNERVVVDLNDKPIKDYGLPDGMAIDTDDNIWVACFFSGKVFKYDPATGEELSSVSFPARLITSCCFGGLNFDEMFVTCSQNDLTEEEKSETPLAGSVFKVTGLGARGLPAPIFQG